MGNANKTNHHCYLSFLRRQKSRVKVSCSCSFYSSIRITLCTIYNGKVAETNQSSSNRSKLERKSVSTKMSYSFEANPRLLVDILHESDQIFEPITGYEQEPLVSLEEACQPLQTILGTELKLYITVAKLNSKECKNGLTQDESASIYLYTMEWNETEKSLFAVFNQTLCTNDRSQLQPWLKYLKLFFTAFVKLP